MAWYNTQNRFRPLKQVCLPLYPWSVAEQWGYNGCCRHYMLAAVVQGLFYLPVGAVGAARQPRPMGGGGGGGVGPGCTKALGG